MKAFFLDNTVVESLCISVSDQENLMFNPLTRKSQKTGSRFVKMHGLYKNRPS